jgi:uncharacterized protein (TIGR03435 family)
MTNVTLAECIQLAYGLASQEQITGPDWIRSRDVRYDIIAKTAVDADLDRARRMPQTLLADRLKLGACRCACSGSCSHVSSGRWSWTRRVLEDAIG